MNAISTRRGEACRARFFLTTPTGPAHAQDLNGRWRSGNTIFEIIDTGGSVSFTLSGLTFTGTVSDGLLTATASTPNCPPVAMFAARVIHTVVSSQLVPDRLNGASRCGPTIIDRFLIQRCDCFDGNSVDGDGCDARCQLEPCFTCVGDPSSCTPRPEDAACDDGRACTASTTCTAGVCGGGTTVPNCTDVTGRWLEQIRSTFLGPIEFKTDVIQTNDIVEVRDATNNPGAHLTCYKTAGAPIGSSARPRIEIGNDLGTLQVEIKRSQLYCERSTKTPLP